MAEVLAIIPARGGSKGIPRKNIRLLAGRPLIGWTILAARKARLVSRVVVSTDDPEIAAIAEAYGAEVVWRPADISGDKASSETALLHTLDHLDAKESYCPDHLAFLQCTSPLILSEDIDGTLEAMRTQQAQTALTVVSNHRFVWKRDGEGHAVGVNHDKSRRLLRQDMEPEFTETGSVYVMETTGFKESQHRFFGKTALHEVSSDRSWEIDDPVDFQVVETLLRERLQQEKAELLPNPVAAVVFDFDGVMTDNRVLLSQDGTEYVTCSRGDGMGVNHLTDAGIPVLILSSEINPVVAARAKKLKIPCLHGHKDKLQPLKDWLAESGVPAEQVVYVGNDVNDLNCLDAVGCGVAVADAHPDILSVATMVLEHNGGFGAVRELCDLILKNRAAS